MPRTSDRLCRLFLLLLIVGAVSVSLAPVPVAAQGRMAAPNWVDPGSDLQPPEILVYYFHNTFRCLTCLTMENMAEEMIRDEFSADLETGILAWRSVNLQEPEFEHFALRYDLDGPSVVMVEWGDDKESRWKNLKRIWELADLPDEYREYVRQELNAYLNDKPEAPQEPKQ